MGGYILLPRARADLREIWTTSFYQWGRTQADRYISDIESRFRAISENPRIGRACNEIRDGYFNIRSGSHFIFYRKNETAVAIVRILHKRQDFKRHL